MSSFIWVREEHALSSVPLLWQDSDARGRAAAKAETPCIVELDRVGVQHCHLSRQVT